MCVVAAADRHPKICLLKLWHMIRVEFPRILEVVSDLFPLEPDFYAASCFNLVPRPYKAGTEGSKPYILVTK